MKIFIYEVVKIRRIWVTITYGWGTFATTRLYLSIK